MDKIEEYIKEGIKEGGIEFINQINKMIFNMSPYKHNPVGYVRWVNIDMIEANDYNPNLVASKELKLLAVSVLHDGYTQPIVTIWDEKSQKFIIVDGYHRYFLMKTNKKIQELNKGLVPIVVIEKDINDRMASTIRHNRARGKHTINGMSSLVTNMIKNGWDDVQICNELGLEPDELLRLKHMTGISSLFLDKEFGKSWEEVYQVKERLKKEKFEEDEKEKEEKEKNENIHKN